MKRLLTFFMSLLFLSNVLTEEFTTGGVYVQLASENQTCNLISKASNIIEKIAVGKTYRVDADVMEFKTKDEQTVALSLSTGLQVKISPNTTFSVDSFNQLVINNESQPEVLKAEYAVTTLTLMDGEVTMICPKLDVNSQCILQTSLVNVILSGGRVSIKSNSKFVMVNAIEGEITVVDSKNRSTIIDKGQLGLIIPYPGREGEVMVTSKTISSDELGKVAQSLEQLEKQRKDVLFIVMDKKVVGVRLK